jgi:hypothetical protein
MLSANARRCIEKRFTARNMVDQTLEVYGRVVRR